MIEAINEKIAVITVYDPTKKGTMPWRLKWRGKVYHVLKLGYHHRVRQGRVLVHIFTVSTNTLSFKLRFDTESLLWTLEEIADGQP